ncbi:MAG: magnesium-dependent phosphatase-1 [Sulfolobaceae archaeon]
MIKVVIFDADKTLWDHHNISEFEGELIRIDKDTITDSKGNKLKLAEGVRDTLEFLKSMKKIIGMATWNYEEKLIKILTMLEIRDYFDIIISRPYPYKFIMIKEIIRMLIERGIQIKPEEILFVDDRRQHFGYVWLYNGNIKCIEMWKDVKSFNELLDFIKKHI